MKCKYLKYISVQNNTKSFQEKWNSIMCKEEINQTNNDVIFDLYFEDVPLSQNYLTFSNMIMKKKIDFSHYVQIPPEQIDKNRIYDCFHGIIFYIYFYSSNQFNIEEIEFHFSGGKLYERFTVEHSKNGSNLNILNLFDYTNFNNEFSIRSTKNAFFGCTFKHIKIKPYAYAIRSGVISPNSSHLISFTFEGYDEARNKWDVLDERVNLNDLIRSGSFSLFYVQSIDKCYSSFKVKQTEPGSNGQWGFTLAAFEIHGIIFSNDESDEKMEHVDENECNIFNPCLDMADYI